ncbi:hypothetical protein SNE26_27875 [Mucilaginibacter sp. cycad4]|uniref:hypothetical protein n=1 Tax=Mucilaginibacter sp. cycad4 TaxID=3342096 RepID=UPI002AAC06A9|nr:hypothetical protein [Mucilaginibacter gossypii]WPU99830.1 hypothetical protein SNE26_27875 [Mucilaginibacter gossypii]
MNFQDVMSLGTFLATVAWMVIAYVLFKLQAKTFELQAETFRTQADTFKEQQKITQLENKKFLLSLRPEFIINNKKLWDGPRFQTANGYLETHEIEVEISVILHSAIDVEFVNNTPFLTSAYKVQNTQFVPIGAQIFILKGPVPKEYSSRKIDVQIFFKDEIGTFYIQYLTGTYAKPEISPPIEFI